MDWNAKSPSQWEWEQSLFLNAKATEISKSQPNWNGETTQEINVGLIDTSGGSACSGSELIHASSSRSSISASNNSSSNRDSKTSMYTLESSLDDSSGKISHALEPSSVSGEPLLSLKLGKRLYFEDVYAGSNSKSPSFSGDPMSSFSTGKIGKSNGQNVQLTRCQVEGCGLDLSSAKDYHRKHRVCESHSKSPKVVIAGMERRFCQQCSRFHDLSEFDEKKRSCRRRLTDHNARRRKPHPVAVRLNQPALSPSLYDGRQHLSPFTYSRTATNLVWQDAHSSKLPQAKDFLFNPAKADNELPSIGTMVYDFNSPFISKGIATKSVNPGIEDSITSSDPNVTQDFNRALSLLSTNSWGSHEPKSISVEHPNKATATVHAMSQRLPLASPEYWHIGQQPVNSGTWISYSNCDDSNRFQECQLFREPYESGFHYNQLD